MPAPPASALTMALAGAPATAMGMTYIAMAQTIGLAMENAVAAQQRGQVIGEAAVVQIVTLIIAAGGAKA